MTVRIVIADDHGLIRAGLAALLNSQPDLQVIGEAPDGDTALNLAQKLQPDVLLADISMPGPSGVEIARVMGTLAPATRVLIVTMHEDYGLAREALAAGAAGYLNKRAAEAELIAAVRMVARGDVYLAPDLANLARASAPQPRGPQASADLAPTEIEMVRLIAHGETYGRIGQTLGLSAEATECVRAELARKLGIYSRTGFVVYAQEKGWL